MSIILVQIKNNLHIFSHMSEFYCATICNEFEVKRKSNILALNKRTDNVCKKCLNFLKYWKYNNNIPARKLKNKKKSICKINKYSKYGHTYWINKSYDSNGNEVK